MLNAMAMMGFLCGSGIFCRLCLLVCNGTVCVGNHMGDEKGPFMRPACTSAAISSAISSQLSSTYGCCSFLMMYSLLKVRRSSMECGSVYLLSDRTCHCSPGCNCPSSGNPALSSCCRMFVWGY